MPIFTVSEWVTEVHRDAILLDTNVLIDAFGETMGDDHLAASLLLFESGRQLLVPIAIVIEAWGFLVGANKNWDAGIEMLTWLLTPGTKVIILPQSNQIESEFGLMKALRVDLVDAMIARLATAISRECRLTPRLPVATKDLSDFVRVFKADDIEITLLDYRSLDFSVG
jgi:hypothetical protein